MLFFSQAHPGTEMLVLSDNYRSTAEILRTATSLIQKNTSRITHLIPGFEKPLHPMVQTDGRVQVLQYHTPEEEEIGVVSTLQRLLQDGGVASEIAILVRTNTEVASWSEILK